MGHGSSVPRKTCHGACEEGAGVVNEVGDDHVHKFLWEPGDLGRTWGRPTGQLLNFDPVSIPEPVSAPELVSE
jgi:hypothetical protein